ncbi:MAG: TadE/TadG family type IV pilus assembly protein [Candidatus Limnocylindria bacterium]
MIVRGRGRSEHPGGQTLAEFALVLPILLVLLLAVADFGRVFAASITTEASARNAAEIGAIERLRNKPPDPIADPSGFNAYYTVLHEQIAKVVCSELSVLPNTTFNAVDRTCSTMPLVQVCVRDDSDGPGPLGDPMCGTTISGFASSIPGQCTDMAPTMLNTSGGADASHAVEVRVCYQFTTLFNLHFTLPGNTGLDLGQVWIQRERVFVLDCPPGDVSTC